MSRGKQVAASADLQHAHASSRADLEQRPPRPQAKMTSSTITPIATSSTLQADRSPQICEPWKGAGQGGSCCASWSCNAHTAHGQPVVARHWMQQLPSLPSGSHIEHTCASASGCVPLLWSLLAGVVQGRSPCPLLLLLPLLPSCSRRRCRRLLFWRLLAMGLVPPGSASERRCGVGVPPSHAKPLAPIASSARISTTVGRILGRARGRPARFGRSPASKGPCRLVCLLHVTRDT